MIINRWLVIFFIGSVLVAGINILLWYNDTQTEPNTFLSTEENVQSPVSAHKKEPLTVEKINRQAPVRQLRKVLIHGELGESDHVLSSQEIDQQTQQLEQELKSLSSENE
ncbi:hypothetical protein VA7868_00126 [Vibrio aerogenes CECT 7868]|uniref:Uncharacterized protein n=1 Tax=Vibrio aerogenes CECT 7868 TaxID=1216006 RepID=A0A1M5UMS5_9VIBR|nr:hypothetical protein [Vibrio aerogenes]SHH64220.1 hypothetical protein VA7868_00126 [Vibrio aerogenes CECT 7868]